PVCGVLVPCARASPARRSCPTRRSSDLRAAISSGAIAPTDGRRTQRRPSTDAAAASIRSISADTSRQSLTYTCTGSAADESSTRSEEHTSELQSRFDLVCRLLLEKKNEK